MSGMVECYLINGEGIHCDFSPAVTNTRVVFGKNQPFLCVEIEVSKYMFDSDDFWAERPHPEGTDPLTRPDLIQNTTPVHIKTYGGEYDLIYTQTLNPNESTYVFLCYTKMWQSKTTEVSSLISDILWSGQANTFNSGILSITCNGITTDTKISNIFLPSNTSGSIYKNVQIVKQSKTTTTNILLQTKATLGSLRVLVPIYTDPTIPTDAIPGYVVPEGDVSFADLQHTMRADTVYASILFDYTVPYSKEDLTDYYQGLFRAIPDIAQHFIIHPATKVQQRVGDQMVEVSSIQDDGILYCQGVEYVTGYGQTLFAWLANVLGGYSGNDLVIDRGYRMETSSNILAKLGYTVEELNTYKSDPSAWTHGDSIYKIIPDTVCYDLIRAVSVATNRYAYFADVPYLSSFEVSDFKPNALSELTIQYTPSDSTYCAYFVPLGETEPQQIILGSGIEYNDQGSTYLVGEQTAKSANASVTVKATDAGTDIAGMPVEVSIDTESIEGSKEILAQVAFNTLVENYHPSNTLSFIALENSSTPATTDYIAYMTRASGLPQASDLNEGKYYIKTGYDDVGLYLSTGTDWTRIQPITGDTVTVYAPSNTYYFSFNGTSWDEYSYVSVVERHALFRPDTRCASLEDTRSHTTLTNVALAYTVLSWPDCTTKYMFGDPIFQDTEETIAELQSIAKQSITNTSVSEALNKPYVTAAIGNIPLDQAGDDLTDFSGLILQKNDSTGVASMDGYMGGQRQARFSSDGAISSGVVTYNSPRSSDPTALTEAGDSVVMDRDGFHTRSWHLYSPSSPQFSYSDGYWVEETKIGVDGEIVAGGGSVSIGRDGLTNYDRAGTPTYTLNNDGLRYRGAPIIDTESGQVHLRVDGAAVDGNLRAVTITLPYVQIDNEGLRTFSKYYWDTESDNYVYYTGDLQCSVGTDGVITAGAGAVKLDATGLSTWIWTDPTKKYSEKLGGYNYDIPEAIKQCAVTTNGELIAGANLYKLDANGLSFNKTPLNTINPSWVRLLYYNQAENQIELPQDIHVTNATIDNLSADKITSGTLRATTAITCAGTISTGNGAVVMGNTSLSTYDVSVPSNPVLQCSIGADGVITAGTTKISNSGLITYYNNAVSTVISNQGRVAIGGRGQQSISIDGGLIKFYGTGSTIATDGTVSGTLGAYITSDGTINGLATNSVHTTQIEDNAVTDAKINTLSAGKIRTGELAVDVELKLTNTGSALLAGPAQTSGGTNYWKVRLDNNGLTTYTQGSTSTSVVPVCTIGADGNINGVKVDAANIKAGTLSSGVIYAGNISANQINTGTLDTANVTVGNGSVVIDNTGLKTYNTTLSRRPVQCSIGTDGAIVAGAGAIRIHSTGLYVYGTGSQSGVQQMSISVDGKLRVADGALQLDSEGLKTFDTTSQSYTMQCTIGTDGSIVAGAGAVKINSTGLRTYIAGTSSEQCRIGTDGEISAGEDTIKLSSAGMTMGVVSSTSSATVLSMSDASYLEIIDGSLIPAVQLSSGGSNFKNGLNTESAIVSQEGYKCGQYNAGLSPGTVTIEAVVGGTSTKQSYSSLVVSPSTMRICRGTFNDIHKCFENTMKSYDIEYEHARQYEGKSNNITVSGSVHPEILDPWVMLEGGWGINEYLELSYDSTRKSENWPSYKVVQTQHNTATDFDDLFPLHPEVENNTLVFNPLSEIYVTTPLQLVQTWYGNMYESFQTRIGYTKVQYAYIYQNNELLPAMLRVSTSGKLYLKDIYGYVEQEAGTIIDPNQQYYYKQGTVYTPIEFNILHPVTNLGYEVIHSDYLIAKEDTNVDTDKYTFYSASSISAKSDTDRIYITHKIPVKMTATSSLPKHILTTGILSTAIYITGTIPVGITVVEYNIKYSLAQSAHVYPLLLGAFYASGAGSVVVSEGGLYGTTRIPSGVSGGTITFTDYALSPLVNQTFLAANISTLYSTGLASTSASTTGVRNILLVGYSAGSQPVLPDPQSAREGDIVMCYKV